MAIWCLKRSKSMEQKQAIVINHDILIKMIDAQLDTLASSHNRAPLSTGCNFLTRGSEIVAIRIYDLNFSPNGALKRFLRKSKPD